MADKQDDTTPTAQFNQADNLLELAWGLIANASSGNWADETDEWQEAARRWRDSYDKYIAVTDMKPSDLDTNTRLSKSPLTEAEKDNT